MTNERHLQLGKYTAISSFCIGTGIFISYFFTSASNLLFAGYGFIVIAGLSNFAILLSLILSKKAWNNKRSFWLTCGLIILNIPVAIIYCWIGIILLNTMRITLTNSTKGNLTDINLTGCETKHIDQLKVGQSKQIWITISGDCGVDINYRLNGVRKKDVVASYLSNDMGGMIKYNIGAVNNTDY